MYGKRERVQGEQQREIRGKEKNKTERTLERKEKREKRKRDREKDWACKLQATVRKMKKYLNNMWHL